jgi:hypothetical protein
MFNLCESKLQLSASSSDIVASGELRVTSDDKRTLDFGTENFSATKLSCSPEVTRDVSQSQKN